MYLFFALFLMMMMMTMMMMMMKCFFQNFSKVCKIFLSAEFCGNLVKTKTLPTFAKKDKPR